MKLVLDLKTSSNSKKATADRRPGATQASVLLVPRRPEASKVQDQSEEHVRSRSEQGRGPMTVK